MTHSSRAGLETCIATAGCPASNHLDGVNGEESCNGHGSCHGAVSLTQTIPWRGAEHIVLLEKGDLLFVDRVARHLFGDVDGPLCEPLSPGEGKG